MRLEFVHRNRKIHCAEVAAAALALFLNAANGYAQSKSGGPPRAAYIQQQLDTVGYYQLPPGETVIERPLRIGPGQRLTGCGFSSALKLLSGDVAIYFGTRDKTIYGSYLDNFLVSGGAVVCERMAQHCAIERVWIVRSPGDGLRVEGPGDKMVFRDVVAWECAGAGIVVRSSGSNNGLLFDHCNAQNNQSYGLVLETVTPGGNISSAVIRDCTIQGNGLNGKTRCQALVAGYVWGTNFENVWIEGATPVGLRTEAREFKGEDGAPLLRRPTSVRIGGASEIHLHKIAVEYASALSPVIDQLAISPKEARIVWRAKQPKDSIIVAQPPEGLMRNLPKDRIVAEETP